MVHFPISTLDVYIHRDVIGPNSKFKLVCLLPIPHSCHPLKIFLHLKILPNRDCYLVDTMTTRTHPRTDRPILIAMYRETTEPLKWTGSMELPRGNRYPRGSFDKKQENEQQVAK